MWLIDILFNHPHHAPRLSFSFIILPSHCNHYRIRYTLYIQNPPSHNSYTPQITLTRLELNLHTSSPRPAHDNTMKFLPSLLILTSLTTLSLADDSCSGDGVWCGSTWWQVKCVNGKTVNSQFCNRGNIVELTGKNDS
jgi:hypothetical protein